MRDIQITLFFVNIRAILVLGETSNNVDAFSPTETRWEDPLSSTAGDVMLQLTVLCGEADSPSLIIARTTVTLFSLIPLKSARIEDIS